jgi:hypothetical protein
VYGFAADIGETTDIGSDEPPWAAQACPPASMAITRPAESLKDGSGFVTSREAGPQKDSPSDRRMASKLVNW